MITFDSVTVTYPGAHVPTLADVDLQIPEGELCLVTGATGAGKSTLLGAACARVPHFTGGLLEGRVLIDGRNTAQHLPRDLADVVGVVTQDPLLGFVTDTVEEELAFAPEQLGLARPVMRKRVEEVLDLLALAPLRSRALTTLSGGEQQRVAIGAVMTAQPNILVLDEPTSALDPTAAEDVLAALTRLVHDLGVTVLLAEHRLERVIQFADSVLQVRPGGTVSYGDPATVLATSAHPPPVVELGLLAGWDPLPLSVRDARRKAGGLRARLPVPGADGEHCAPSGGGDHCAPAGGGNAAPGWVRRRATGDDADTAAGDDGQSQSQSQSQRGRASGPVLLGARRLQVTYGQVEAVRDLDLAVRRDEVLAVMGRNGSGKTSLLWALQGSGPRSGGQVCLPSAAGSPDPARLSPAEARRHVALVPQTPSHLLYHPTVAAECAAADADAGAPDGTTAALFARLTPGVGAWAGQRAAGPGDTGLESSGAGDGGPLRSGPADVARMNPADLSEGGRLALALAVQLAADPAVLLLDEPTRGLDYGAKEALAALLTERSRAGAAVVLTSHDVEFVARCANRVVTMAQGQIVADGPARQILVASATLAPQTAKILHPLGYLTVAEVRQVLAVRP